MGLELGAALGQVACDRLGGGAAQWDDPLLHPLAQDADTAGLEVDVAELEVAQLGGAQAAGVEQLEDRDLATEQGGAGVGGGDQLRNLLAVQDFGQMALRLGALQLLEDVGAVVAE